jgi:hypothetical protein
MMVCTRTDWAVSCLFYSVVCKACRYVTRSAAPDPVDSSAMIGVAVIRARQRVIERILLRDSASARAHRH